MDDRNVVLNVLPEGITIGISGGGIGRPVLKLGKPVYAPYATGPIALDTPGYATEVEHVCVFFPPGPWSTERIVVCPCSPRGYLWGTLKAPDLAVVIDQVRERMEDLLEVEERRKCQR